MTSTLRRTSSAAKSGSRSAFPSAERISSCIFCPSTYPVSRRPCRSTSRKTLGSGAPTTSTPTLFPSWAVPARGHAVMADSNVMNSRLFTDHLIGADQGFISVHCHPRQCLRWPPSRSLRAYRCAAAPCVPICREQWDARAEIATVDAVALLGGTSYVVQKLLAAIHRTSQTRNLHPKICHDQYGKIPKILAGTS